MVACAYASSVNPIEMSAFGPHQRSLAAVVEFHGPQSACGSLPPELRAANEELLKEGVRMPGGEEAPPGMLGRHAGCQLSAAPTFERV